MSFSLSRGSAFILANRRVLLEGQDPAVSSSAPSLHRGGLHLELPTRVRLEASQGHPHAARGADPTVRDAPPRATASDPFPKACTSAPHALTRLSSGQTWSPTSAHSMSSSAPRNDAS